MVNNTLTNLILSAMILVAGILGALGGYRYGYDRATLESQVLVARKDAELAVAKAAPAAPAARDGGGGGEAANNKKKEFAPSSLTDADLTMVDGLADLSAQAKEDAIYALNNIPGGCVPCSETGKSLAQCLLDVPKLVDRSNCANITGLVNRTVKLAKAGRSIDDIRAAVDLGVWYPISPGDAPSKGPVTAPVTVIEYSDFQCPYCKKAVANLKAIEEKYGDKVRMVFMNQPLAMHKMAGPAAKAALAGHLQGKFWLFHDALFMAPKMDEEQLVTIAKDLKLDMAKWEADRGSSAIDRRVSEDVQRATRFSITSTPTFFVNGYRIKGAQPPPAFEKIIDAELADRG